MFATNNSSIADAMTLLPIEITDSFIFYFMHLEILFREGSTGFTIRTAKDNQGSKSLGTSD